MVTLSGFPIFKLWEELVPLALLGSLSLVAPMVANDLQNSADEGHEGD
jgi:hypothetical protein